MTLRVLGWALIGALALAVPATVASSEELPVPIRGALAASAPPTASVNICGQPGAGTLGVRVSAPYRSDHLEPWVRVQVEWYSSADGAWRLVSAGGDSGWYRASDFGTGAWTGYTFPFSPPSEDRRLVMRGVASLEWRDEQGLVAARDRAITSSCELAGP